MSKKDKNQFKDTLNLPKTSFPMKANLAQNEPQTLKKMDTRKPLSTTSRL